MSYGPCEEEESCRTGSEERWPSMFAHAMGHGVFRRERWRGGRREKKARGERKKNPLKESGGHMSSSLLSILVLQDLKLNIDAEDEDKVEQGLNGGEKMSVSLTPACSPGCKGKDDDPDLQSQAPLS